MSPRIKTFIIVGAAVITVDHVVKWIVKSTMELNQTIEVIGNFFTLSYIINTGIAFGFFDGSRSRAKMPLLVAVSIIALAIIIYIFLSLPKRAKLAGPAMGLIFGGAIGNMIDRIVRGRVIDFLDVDFPDIAVKPLGIYLTRWPTFNVADSCVFVGIIMLLVIIIIEGGKAEPKGAERGADLPSDRE
jgi:signal peptidase II